MYPVPRADYGVLRARENRLSTSAPRQRPIRLGLKSFATFVCAKPARGRRILHDHKYPEPEGAAQAKYYGQALSAIARYHTHAHEAEWLGQKAEELRGEAAQTGRQQLATKLRSNAKALDAYAEHFALPKYTGEPPPQLSLRIGRIVVGASPDLSLLVRGDARLVKLAISKEAQDAEVARVMAQVMFEAARRDDPTLASSRIRVLNLATGEEIRGARLGSRRMNDIEAACETIEALWDAM